MHFPSVLSSIRMVISERRSEAIALTAKHFPLDKSVPRQALLQNSLGDRTPSCEKLQLLADHYPGPAEGQPQRAETRSPSARTSVSEAANRLSEDVYDHLLRESGDFTNPCEWYEIAIVAADRLKELILESRDRNMSSFRSRY